MRIFLSGPMGSGKTTVAKVVARRSGLALIDLDAEVERRAGVSIPRLFEQRGEAAFRELERSALRELLSAQPRGVFALGGGTVVDRALRRELLAQGTLITLQAPEAELLRRVGDGAGRPLLAGHDTAGRLAALLAVRAEAYAECHGIIDTSALDLESAASAVLELATEAPVVVPLGLRSYRVEIGSGVRARAPARAERLGSSPALIVVSDERVAPLWAEPLVSALRAAGKRVTSVVLGAGEPHKTLASVERIWDAALSAGADRGSGVLAVGGGVVGDLAGFAASTLLRGVAVGHVPTTLLAMVDSAIGGKTGFDTRHGKNLVGTFHQPSFVLCDPDVLDTLDARERRAGLAEVVKSAWLDGEAAVAQLERDREALAAFEPPAIARAIRMSAALKARVVTEDEREAGVRACLNLGHTLGHAIEAAEGYAGLRHGEAVALGMVAAFELSSRLGVARHEHLERVRGLLSGLGLGTDVGPYLEPRVLSFMGADKKRRSDRVTFVLPGAPGEVRLESIPLPRLEALLLAK